MHSCAEQAAGSYSRPGNIHEFFPFSPNHRYFINALLEFQDPPHHYGEHERDTADRRPLDLIRKMYVYLSRPTVLI